MGRDRVAKTKGVWIAYLYKEVITIREKYKGLFKSLELQLPLTECLLLHAKQAVESVFCILGP